MNSPFCECSSLDCTIKIAISMDQYNEITDRLIAQHPYIYVVAPEHTEGHVPLETGAGYAVIEEPHE